MSELGATLKEAREKKGLSLDDLQNITKIQKRYLVGIENGNYEMMPGKFYVRAFIKQYAEAVGLEPEEVFEQFKNEIPSVHHEEGTEQLSRVQAKKTVSPAHSKFIDVLPKVLVAVFILGAAVLAWVLISKNISPAESNKNDTGSELVKIEENEDSPLNSGDEASNEESAEVTEKEDEKNTDDKEQEKEQTASELTVVESSGKNTTYELKNSDEFKVKFVSTGSAWVGVVDSNGSYLFQQALADGQETEEQDLSGQEEVLLNIGNAAQTEIYVNGKLLEYEVSPSEQVTQKITIKYVQDDKSETE
ncbi:MAG: helix-turn-helix domain-containing protein [Bacillus sp. (in: firmicutes)]